jgi:polyisoprenoid-binding protein YceI
MQRTARNVDGSPGNAGLTLTAKEPFMSGLAIDRRIPVALLVIALHGGLSPALARAAESYVFDPAHTSVTFKIEHLGISWVQGRFDDLAGACTIDDDDPAKSTFSMTIKTASIDTNVADRDNHLRSPDFFDVKQFPEMVFKSTAVRKTDDGLEVTGDFSLHGVTKSITFTLVGGQKTEFPKGTQRIGYVTAFQLKRSDFGMTKMIPDVGDEVRIFISFEATAK